MILHRSPNRFVIPDLIRIIALLMVVWTHILPAMGIHGKLNWGWIYGVYEVTLGNLGVTLFIILSGLLLQLRYGKHRGSWRSFYIKRGERIYFTYWLSLTVAYLFLRWYTPPFQISVDEWFCSAIGACAFYGKWGGPILATSWFIGVIVALYALFPVISKQIRIRPNVTLWALFFVSVVTRQITTLTQPLAVPPAMHWNPIARVFEFGLGIYLANKIPAKFWNYIRIPKLISKILAFGSDLTFPIFLIHVTFLPIINQIKIYMGSVGAIATFALIVIVVAIGIVIIEKPIREFSHRSGSKLFKFIESVIPE